MRQWSSFFDIQGTGISWFVGAYGFLWFVGDYMDDITGKYDYAWVCTSSSRYEMDTGIVSWDFWGWFFDCDILEESSNRFVSASNNCNFVCYEPMYVGNP